MWESIEYVPGAGMEGEKRASCKSEAQPAGGACTVRPGTLRRTVGDPGWRGPGAVLRQGLQEDAGGHPGTAGCPTTSKHLTFVWNIYLFRVFSHFRSFLALNIPPR